MRVIAVTLLAVAATAVAATVAEAQSRRPLRVIVQPRSYLDPGKVVPVGSLSNYAMADRFSPPASSHAVTRGDVNLPPRIGGGRNPFGPIGW